MLASLAVAKPSIVVHGGAGAVEDERRARVIAGCEAAVERGWQLLARGGSALDAVEAAVRALEDDPEYNAGYGAVLNRLGTVEVDACLMDGDLRAGAVAAVPWMRHPITLARRVLEDGEHVLLVGGGALLYAREHGLSGDPPESMISPRARARHERERVARATEPGIGDTVGACAVDAAGRVAAATSTGGTPWKRPGRVGDSPLPGAGNYADRLAGAASATGHGESIMRVVLAKSVIDRLRAGADPDEAARAAVQLLVERTGGEAGVIVVGVDGRVGHFSSTPRMPWAAVEDGQRSSGAEHAQ
jgi:beta-aspartyl-peptidase (threonine type)